MDVSKTCEYVQIKIKMLNPGQDPTTSPKAQNQDFKGMDMGKNLEHVSTKDQCPYKNQDQDAKPQSGTSRVL